MLDVSYKHSNAKNATNVAIVVVAVCVLFVVPFCINAAYLFTDTNDVIVSRRINESQQQQQISDDTEKKIPNGQSIVIMNWVFIAAAILAFAVLFGFYTYHYHNKSNHNSDNQLYLSQVLIVLIVFSIMCLSGYFAIQYIYLREFLVKYHLDSMQQQDDNNKSFSVGYSAAQLAYTQQTSYVLGIVGLSVIAFVIASMVIATAYIYIDHKK